MSNHSVPKPLQALQGAPLAIDHTLRGILLLPPLNLFQPVLARRLGLGKEDPYLDTGIYLEGTLPTCPHTPTVVKIAGLVPWIYHSQLKKITKDNDRWAVTQTSGL